MQVKEKVQTSKVSLKVKNENPLWPQGGPLSQYDRPLAWYDTMSVRKKLEITKNMPYGIGKGVCD